MLYASTVIIYDPAYQSISPEWVKELKGTTLELIEMDCGTVMWCSHKPLAPLAQPHTISTLLLTNTTARVKADP